MTKKYIAFDLEIAKQIPEDATDWKALGPLGITCAAAYSTDGRQWLWYANEFGEFQPQMTPGAVQEIVLTLEALVSDGYTLLTWNGLSFDFWVLAQESQMFIDCKRLAMDHHIDMMFHFFAEKGFPLGLDTAAKGMGLPGKPQDIDGAKAPELWKQGQYTKVLDYVMGDSFQTLEVARAIEQKGRLDWIAKSGRPNSWGCAEWLKVKAALELPEPDTSWMSEPWPRSKFYDWTR